MPWIQPLTESEYRAEYRAVLIAEIREHARIVRVVFLKRPAIFINIRDGEIVKENL